MRPLWVAITGLLALAACAQLPPPSYDVDRACRAAGFAAGTAAYDECVTDKQAAELRRLYDLGVRDRPTMRAQP